MFNVSKKISFSVVVAILIGWGICFLLFMASAKTALQSEFANEQPVVVTRALRLTVQVDKRVYATEDRVLIAVRNDSRMPIWIQQVGADCPLLWWNVERLGADGQTWLPVTLQKVVCEGTHTIQFPNHSLKSGEWNLQEAGAQIGNVTVNVLTGTYRISIPYLRGEAKDATTWPGAATRTVTSSPFTVQ